MTKETEAQRLAKVIGGKCADELLRLESINEELITVLKEAERTIDVLWVSHHANRADHTLDLIRSTLTKHEGSK